MAKKDTDLSWLADQKIEMAMSQAPTIATTGETTVQQDYMDEAITDYAAAKSEVKQSFFGKLFGQEEETQPAPQNAWIWWEFNTKMISIIKPETRKIG